MPSAPEVYAKELAHHKLGYPLWVPEPEKSGEVLIGDVGFVREGRFRRLFNAMRPSDDPVNGGRVPEGFQQLVLYADMVETLDTYLPPSAISSESTILLEGALGADTNGLGASYKLEFHRDQAAVLVLGDWAARSTMDDNDHVHKYVRDHYDSWFAFARRLEYRIKQNEIVFVSGWIKTSDWALAACTSSARGHRFSITAGLGTTSSVNLHVDATAEHTLSALQRRRPPVESIEGTAKPPKDQCLFLEFIKGKTKWFSWKKYGAESTRRLLNAPESKTPGRVSPFETLPTGMSQGQCALLQSLASSVAHDVVQQDGVHVESAVDQSSASSVYNPVDDLLDYILENSSAEFATASHDDLYKICGDEWPTDFKSYFESLSLQIDLSDGVGRINHACARNLETPASIQIEDDRIGALRFNHALEVSRWRWRQHSFQPDVHIFAHRRDTPIQQHLPATLLHPSISTSHKSMITNLASDSAGSGSYLGHIMTIALLAHTLSYRTCMNARVPLTTYLMIGAGLGAGVYVGHGYNSTTMRSEWENVRPGGLRRRSDIVLKALHWLGTELVDIGLGMRQEVMYAY